MSFWLVQLSPAKSTFAGHGQGNGALDHASAGAGDFGLIAAEPATPASMRKLVSK